MTLENHYQNAYITRDLDQAMEFFKTRYGFDNFMHLEVKQQLTTRAGQGEAVVRLALGWIGNLQYELIQPISGNIGVYLDGVPDRDSLYFHHICMRVPDNWVQFRTELDRLKRPIVMEGGTPGQLQFVYVDARDTVGHYLEYCWMTPERWSGMLALGKGTRR